MLVFCVQKIKTPKALWEHTRDIMNELIDHMGLVSVGAVIFHFIFMLFNRFIYTYIFVHSLLFHGLSQPRNLFHVHLFTFIHLFSIIVLLACLHTRHNIHIIYTYTVFLFFFLFLLLFLFLFLLLLSFSFSSSSVSSSSPMCHQCAIGLRLVSHSELGTLESTMDGEALASLRCSILHDIRQYEDAYS